MRCPKHPGDSAKQRWDHLCHRCEGGKAPFTKLCLTCSEALEVCEVCEKPVRGEVSSGR